LGGGNALFLIGLFLLNVAALFGQNFSCGTVAPTEQVRLQSYQAVGFGPGAISTASSIQTTFNIPIKAYVITNNGNYSFIEPEYWMHEAIRWMNQRFVTQNVSFYLCSIETRENPNYYNIVENGTVLTELNNLYGDPQALNVFLVNNIDGSTAFYSPGPNGNVQNAIAIESLQGRLHFLAHEIGHFLGLDHTFERTGGTIFCSNGPTRVPRLRPNSTCLIPNSTCACLFNVCNAETSGDFIADTPVDPNVADENNILLCSSGSECDEICPLTIIAGGPNNPCFQETLVYTPPRSNIMSYHSESCINSFSPLQLELMKRMLNNGPGYAFLRDQIVPTCQASSVISSQGKVSYFFDADGAGGNEEELLPFPGLKVKITAGSGSITNNTNTQGIYNVNQTVVNGQTYTFGPDLVGEAAIWNEPLAGVSTADLIQVQRYLNILRGFNNYNLIAADADGNGIIQSADINTIRNVILNISPNFGAVPTWRFVPESLIFGDNPSFWLTKVNHNVPTATVSRTSSLKNDWVAFNGQLRPYLCSGCNDYFAQINFTAPYKPVSNTKAWSYVGVKTGDVNYSTSISPTQFRTPDISTSYSSGSSLRSGEAKLSIKKGESFTVLVTAKPKGKTMNILGYQMGLKINPELAELSGVSPGEVRKFEMDAFALERQEKGVIKTLWYDNEPIKLSGEKVLFEVTLNAKADISDLAQAIGLSPETLQPEFVSDQEELLVPEIGFKVKNGQNSFSSIKVYPNPTQAALSFEIDFATAGDAVIMLNDQYGNRLHQAFKVQKGKNTLLFEQTNGLLPGVLSYMISNSGSTLSGQVVKHK
jgi:hypothetical protein